MEDGIRAGLGRTCPTRYADELDADLRHRDQRPHQRTRPGRGPHRPAGSFGGTGTRRAAAGSSASLDGGIIHHPLFGNREHWYAQEVQPGWFTGPAEAAGPRVRAGIERALEDVANKATKGP